MYVTPLRTDFINPRRILFLIFQTAAELSASEAREAKGRALSLTAAETVQQEHVQAMLELRQHRRLRHEMMRYVGYITSNGL
jgi:hypothetical protein